MEKDKNWLQQKVDKLESDFENKISGIDNAISKAPPFRGGKNVGGIVNKWIDKVIDKLF
jgi:hypothetical protein